MAISELSDLALCCPVLVSEACRQIETLASAPFFQLICDREKDVREQTFPRIRDLPNCTLSAMVTSFGKLLTALTSVEDGSSDSLRGLSVCACVLPEAIEYAAALWDNIKSQSSRGSKECENNEIRSLA